MKNKKKKNKSENIKFRIAELIKKINYHDNLYYKKNFQEISDDEYDKFRLDLLELEKAYPQEKPQNSPNNKVGKIDNETFQTEKHITPMLSLNNAYNELEVKTFYEKIVSMTEKNNSILAETKVDGLSASIRYENRVLKLGLTRGDGSKGENITRNLEHIEGIKKKLPKEFPKDLEIRGEIFMKKNIFAELNKSRKLKGLPLFSTPRNAAAGSARQLNPDITKSRKLSFYGYTLIGDESFFGDSLNNIRQLLLKYNFLLNKPSQLCNSLEEMLDFYNKVNNSRSSLNYDIDGIVYKIDSIKEQKVLGETSRWPRWALAHKFPAENAITTIKNVTFQVGRTGSITPVATLKSVVIGGVKINRATLHNKDEINRLNLLIGDTVSIQRAGDVIPKITSVIKKADNPKEIKFPLFCPSCNSKLKKNEGEVAVRCVNHNKCKEQIINGLSHFVSRNAFDISGLGERQIRIFWEKNLIRNFCDIFTLEDRNKQNRLNIEDIEGFGQKSILNLYRSINLSKSISFERFIYSLGIRHVGQGIALILSRKFKNIEKFINYFYNCKYSEDIDGIGYIIFLSIKKYLEDNSNLLKLNNLLKLVNINYDNLKRKKLSNKKIVITGTFKNYTRKIIEKKLIAMGASISSNISFRTDFLLCGDNPGSKLDKAKILEVKILFIKEVEDFIKSD